MTLGRRSYRWFARPGRLGLVVAGFLVACLVAASAQAVDPTFTPAAGSPFAVGDIPFSVAIGNLNADVFPDLAVANSTSNSVTVLLGNGTGGFAPAAGSPFTVGTSPRVAALADVNADGKTDIVAANRNSNDVTILLGNGTGGFAVSASSPFTVGTQPRAIAVTDVTGDGKPDLAVANSGSDNVTVLRNTTGPPTAVALRGFAARRTPQGVELRWWTAQDAGLLGFNVHRFGVRLNRTLIAARGTISGASYRVVDRRASGGAYRLQAVHLDGTRSWIGRAVTAR